MTRLRRQVARTGRFWLVLLAFLTLLQGLQPLLHAHPRSERIDAAVSATDAGGARFALHLPDSVATHALADRPGPAPLTVTAESERCRSLDGMALPAMAPPMRLSVAVPPDTRVRPAHAVLLPERRDPFVALAAARGPPPA